MLDFSYDDSYNTLEKLKILNKKVLDEVDLAFDVSALRVLASRYLLRNAEGIITESPKQMFERIAVLVAISDILHDERVFDINGAQTKQRGDIWINPHSIGRYELNEYHKEALVRLFRELDDGGHMRDNLGGISKMIQDGRFDSYEARIREYYDLMVSKDFLPNTPTLMNAGAPLGQLSACFVLDIEDDMSAIMDTAKDVAMIFKSGGGVGINYSKLRPEGATVSSTSGVASGPLSFMKVIDAVTGVVKQGGKRRGANMGIMDVSHPDCAKFIQAKTTPGVLENFNISVGIYEEFWHALVGGGDYSLINPHNGAQTGTLNACETMDMIAKSAHASAEPGMIFFDNINKYNPCLAVKGALNATNPCGEQSLYAYESCNLGSINLANFVKDGQFDFLRFEDVVKLCTRFLDNVIDVNKYPLARINEETKKTRRIGLGIMGLADALFKLNVAYNSKEGYELMDEIAESLAFNSMRESMDIASERGAFPLFKDSTYVNGELPFEGRDLDGVGWLLLRAAIMDHGIRNAWTTTIAPTGTLSMLAGCSSGIEPIFALSFEKHVTVGKFIYTNEIFEETLEKGLLDTLEQDLVIREVVDNYGSCKGLEGIPDRIQRVFVTAMDMHWADHIYAEAVMQRWISNAISKTINMAKDATVQDVRRAYLIAHELGLKGVSIYRDGSRHAQVLHINNADKTKAFEVRPSEHFQRIAETITNEPYVLDEIRAVVKPEDIWAPRIEKLAGGLTLVHFTGSALGCPGCGAHVTKEEGCLSCKSCGWSACAS